MHHELPASSERAAAWPAPGDGVIHSWLNRLLLPDTVGTGGDSHTRFSRSASPSPARAWSLRSPRHRRDAAGHAESVLVRFKGTMRPGITCATWSMRSRSTRSSRPADRREEGQEERLSGRILEIEGPPDLKVEQAFELSDASVERSAAGCTVHLNKAPVEEYIRSNITLMKWMINHLI